jgi:subtilisin family serine protease
VFELRSISLFFVHFAIIDPAASVASVITRLELDSAVNYAQHVYRYFASDSAPQQDYVGKQYAIGQIRADLVQRFSTGRRVKIALLDSWVDARHPDLRGKISPGRDFTDGEVNARDVHGTSIAGIIVAIPRNHLGIDGVAPGATILPIKVLTQTSPQSGPEGTPVTVGRGLDFAIKSKVHLVNMSYGSTEPDPTIVRVVKRARALGIVLVAAAGNDGPGGQARYPAAMNDEVIAVAAVNNNRESYAGGTRGDYIDLAAPGVDVLSTWPRNVFQYGEGSSLAAAHVTGVVALLLSKRRRTTPKRIQTVLEQTSTPLGAGGKDIVFGSGLVDACRAMEMLLERGGLCR